MKLVNYLYMLFSKFKFLFLVNTFLFVCVGFLEMLSIVTVVPVIEMFLAPTLDNPSRITGKVIALIDLLGFAEPLDKGDLVVALLVIIAFANVSNIFAIYFIQKTRMILLQDLITELYTDCFNASWSFFSSGNRGTMMNTYNREVEMMGNSFRILGTMISSMFRIVFLLALPLYLSLKLTLILIGLGGVVVSPLLLIGPISYRLGKQSTEWSNRFNIVIQESFEAAKIILGYGVHVKQKEIIDTTYGNLNKVCTRFYTLQASIPYLFQPIGLAVMLLAIYVSIEYYNLPLSEAGIIVFTLYRLIPVVGSVVADRSHIYSVIPNYEQINRLTTNAREHAQKTGSRKFRRLERGIELNCVHYSYPNRGKVLMDANMSFEKDKMTAIVGESGAGKSTIIDLVVGFYEPSEGEITIDGVPLNAYDIYSFRQRVGYVPQDVMLFNKSIKENVLWSAEDAGDHEMIEALKIANAYDFIRDMPDKFDTLVGQNGVQLSGGQRQRIALARAIIRNPEVLILDEATSALDSKSETLIQNAIEEIAKKVTIIIIAHRLSTIKNADQIYVLSEGRIVDTGKFDVLVGRRGEFETFATSQKIG